MSADLLTFDMAIENPLDVSPQTYQYYSGLQKRRIIISDDIDGDLLHTAVIPLLDMDADGTGEPIEIMLSSHGGNLMDGFYLCNIIDYLQTPTTIRVMGYAQSLAGLILAAGFHNPNVRKVCYPFSTALLHSGETCIAAAANAAKDTFNFLEKMDKQIKDYILSHSYITEEEYEKMERFEWYMCADDMLKHGLVDEVLNG